MGRLTSIAPEGCTNTIKMEPLPPQRSLRWEESNWLHNPYRFKVSKAEKNQSGCIPPAFLESPVVCAWVGGLFSCMRKIRHFLVK